MRIQIVDEHDSLIGLKERSEIDYEKDIYRVSALWLTNSKGQALLAKRAAVKEKFPNRWGPAVTGTLDEGETYEDNIYKEAMEEIGLEGYKFVKGPKTRIRSPVNHFTQWYFVNIDCDASSFTMQSDEVDDLEWFDIEHIKKDSFDNPDSYIPKMKRLVKDLNL